MDSQMMKEEDFEDYCYFTSENADSKSTAEKLAQVVSLARSMLDHFF